MAAEHSLVSLVLRLRPEQPAVVPRAHGHLVHGWFLDLVARMDRELAQALHPPQPSKRGDRTLDAFYALKPFTLSPLKGAGPARGNTLTVTAGEVCELRVTSLEPRLSDLLRALTPCAIGRVSLADADFVVNHVVTDANDHPWASATSYQALWERWRGLTEPPRRVRWRFLSPTAFTSGRQNIPLPRPELIVQGLAAKWNRYCPPSLKIEDVPSVARAIWVARYRLRTELLEFPDYSQVGFLGTCDFVIDDRADLSAARMAHLLSDFAFYAGVGYKTTMGMGQVRAWKCTVQGRKADGSGAGTSLRRSGHLSG